MTRTLLSLAALALLAGCGSPEPAPTTSATASHTASAPASSTASPPPSSSAAVSASPPSEAVEKVRLTADVLAPPDAGGCVAVRSDVGVRWALRGAAVADLAAGDRVDVVGSPRPGGGGCDDGQAVLAVRTVVVSG